MPYRRILEELLASVEGARTALLLDSEGEVVVGAGDLDEQHRLIGAYQGIALGMASRAAERFQLGTIGTLVWRYGRGSVVLATLRDGYYLVLSVAASTPVAVAEHRCQKARERLNQEI